MTERAGWDPALYRRFEDERTRPARELLARVPLERPARVVDLGCGPGNSTALLCERWPKAEVVGVDNDPAMLASARERLPAVRFDAGDIADWAPPEPPDLLFSNAALQWVGDHETLIPRLFGLLAPGGVLAVQMPDNRDEPTHRLMRELAAAPRYATHLGDAAALRTGRLPLAAYYDLLAPQAADVDAWRTTYQHRMDSAASIVDWVSATGLRPFVEPLPAAERAAYRAEYGHAIDAAYPVRADGRRLLAFPRLFFVACRLP
ncbi:trans-aconitate 2-methyltransferase [Piscinibacter sakaiensis]|uniref:Trans-aconitate 2-methyltransferase n=1 Tax=Piscinibacter sakaiensis TaxID=1547922 RepID=A0A0K8P204_PISS1|nr:trans-aconitate 2-methyltransferase [Piscinibacter sakaiensis]GAP36589.1 trans-aconitate 2-methyltransferase [Piscinibacter sakaiensis]